MTTLFTINRILRDRSAREWRRLLEQSRRLVGLFNKAQLVVFGRLAKGHCLGTLHMSRRILALYRKNGALFTAKYLKQCSHAVLVYVGSQGELLTNLSVPVSLTRKGLPRIIPSMFRKRIMQGDREVLRLVLTVLSLYRLMKVGPKGWRRIAHKTIHIPSYRPSEETMEWSKKLLTSGASMLAAYVPKYRELPINFGFSWYPVFTSGPNTYKKPDEASLSARARKALSAYLAQRRRKGQKASKYSLTVFHTLPVDATAAITLLKPPQLSSLAAMFAHSRVFYPLDGYDRPVEKSREGVDVIHWFINDLMVEVAEKLWWPSMTTRPESGRFGLKLEGAGKVRVFAIPNPIFQRFLKPLHDWEMSVLKQLDTDGTYDQLRPLHRLKGKRVLYSFDLSAATDMFPKVLSASMLSGLFGDEFGAAWYDMMSNTAFRSPERLSSPLKARVYRFTRGQPLGFYSSWPTFSLTHHMVVWLAAWRVYPGKKFWDYALLGDDIVIADEAVALEYRDIMQQMGGVINMTKSLISHNGCCEFAKRFMVNYHIGGGTDCSPSSLPNILLAHSSLAATTLKTLGAEYSVTFRLRGAGYRVLSKIDRGSPVRTFQGLSRRWKRHWLSLFSRSGVQPLPLKLWLVLPEGGVLDPYLEGVARSYLLERAKPKDIDQQSVDMVRLFWEGFEDTFERLLITFVQQHCAHVAWWCTMVRNFDAPLEDLLTIPQSAKSLDRKSTEEIPETYGPALRLWDVIRARPKPRALAARDFWVTWVG
ncbi:RNA-dependent RNA polymerase [Ocimum basilicum RNA virus 2]|uniref:RNA-dependent RNA polymerase n=1 Tax=Ocimum basilicum RNA virus 2 TaxID=2020287 RepID=UPI000B61A170|nr:RNA-dependent RNA polymerase [Ocimum basilicum RNA virus 2]ASL68498.1 RNA-dependent RNA polymerase [Ocimum basilicum RNA virus 2]